MANIILNGKTVVTQTGNDEPVLGSNVILTNDSLASATFPAGHVIQVVHAQKSSTWSYTAGSGPDNYGSITGLAPAITPLYSDSKILIYVNLYIGTSNYQTKYRILKNGNSLTNLLGDAEGGRPQSVGNVINYDNDGTTMGYSLVMLTGIHQDISNSTNQLTYQIQAAAYNGTIVYLNRNHNWQNSPTGGYDAVPSSTVTLMEIKS
jgi:hypothetical protein